MSGSIFDFPDDAESQNPGVRHASSAKRKRTYGKQSKPDSERTDGPSRLKTQDGTDETIAKPATLACGANDQDTAQSIVANQEQNDPLVGSPMDDPPSTPNRASRSRIRSNESILSASPSLTPGQQSVFGLVPESPNHKGRTRERRREKTSEELLKNSPRKKLGFTQTSWTSPNRRLEQEDPKDEKDEVPFRSSLSSSLSKEARKLTGSTITRTYEFSRSYLASNNDEDPLTTELLPQPHSPSNEPDQGSASRLRSSHDLKLSGGNRRFVQDAEYILHGYFHGSTDSQRRSSILEISEKIEDIQFQLSFRANNFSEQLFAQASEENDPIVCYCLFYIYLVMNRESHVILDSAQVLSLCCRCMSSHEDVLKTAQDRAVGLTKAMLPVFEKVLRNSESILTAFDLEQSHTRLGVLALAVSLKELESCGQQLDARVSRIVEDCTMGLLHLIDINNYAGHTTFLQRDVLVIMCIASAMSYTLSEPVKSKACCFLGDMLSALVKRLHTKNAADSNAHLRLATETCRALVNLSNEGSTACDAMIGTFTVDTLTLLLPANPRAVTLDCEKDLMTEFLLISLGLCANLVEVSSTWAQMLLDDAISMKRIGDIISDHQNQDKDSVLVRQYVALVMGRLLVCEDAQERAQRRAIVQAYTQGISAEQLAADVANFGGMHENISVEAPALLKHLTTSTSRDMHALASRILNSA